MTTIHAGDGWSYTLTSFDKIVLAVSGWKEGGEDPADVWWCYAQRLAQGPRRRQTMAEVVFGHSQAVNPKWRRNGFFCGPGGQFANNQTACSESQLDHRDANALAIQSGWTAIPERIRSRFASWENGKVPNRVPRAIDFAGAARVANQNHPDREIILRAGNWFIADSDSLRWPNNWVTLDTMRSGLPVALVVGATALGALAAWKTHADPNWLARLTGRRIRL